MMKVSRRKFLLGTTAMSLSTTGCGAYSNLFQASNAIKSKTPLPIPKLLDTKINSSYQINIQAGKHEFSPGVTSDTKGFDGDYLGPTLRLYKGKTSAITFSNQLNEPTTIHGHGLHVDGKWDGGPQNIIQPNSSITYHYNIIQQASTNWYHPHLMGKTAAHVHAGLAGLILIEDDNSLSLDLPNDYGIDDIPVVTQDRTFVNGVMKPYAVTMQQIMEGLREETLITNGAIAPFHEVPAGWIRLRLLNGSNARYHRFTLSNGDCFFKIATDGGLLASPVPLSSLVMAPGERNEILIDMRSAKVNTLLADFDGGEENAFTRLFHPSQVALELRANDSLPAHDQVPAILNSLNFHKASDIAIVRNFVLEMNGGGENGGNQDSSMHDHHSMFSINGQSMRMDVINHHGTTGQVELWKIRGEGMRHPFHMHGTSFIILSRNGSAPAPEDLGWKDTVDINDGITEVLMKFEVTASKQYPFMYHCHILEHEDAGMMGQFTIESPS